MGLHFGYLRSSSFKEMSITDWPLAEHFIHNLMFYPNSSMSVFVYQTFLTANILPHRSRKSTGVPNINDDSHILASKEAGSVRQKVQYQDRETATCNSSSTLELTPTATRQNDLLSKRTIRDQLEVFQMKRKHDVLMELSMDINELTKRWSFSSMNAHVLFWNSISRRKNAKHTFNYQEKKNLKRFVEGSKSITYKP